MSRNSCSGYLRSGLNVAVSQCGPLGLRLGRGRTEQGEFVLLIATRAAHSLTHRSLCLSSPLCLVCPSDGGANEVLLEVIGKGLGFKPQRMHTSKL